MTKIDPILQPTKFGNHLVPGLWRYMLPEQIWEMGVPEEKLSTCMSCPQVVKEGYREDYRCCTYHPAVPNYGLGLALKTKLGQGNVRKMIQSGLALPEGTMQTPRSYYDYLADSKNDTFGKSKDVNCHFLDTKSGFCTIYAFRNSVCSTFFCIHDHGKKGDKFWDGVQELVNSVENSLVQWSLDQVGFSSKDYFERFDELSINLGLMQNKDKSWTEDARKVLFDNYYGKEEELFLKCADVVSQNRDELWEIISEHKIESAETFEKIQIAAVPKDLRCEIEDDDLEDGDPATPSELWDDLKTVHKSLWKIPTKKLILNPRVEFADNDYDEPEEKFYKDMPVALNFLDKKNGSEFEWRTFIDKDTQSFLEKFSKPRKITEQFLSKTENSDTISEWIGRKVLITDKDSR